MEALISDCVCLSVCLSVTPEGSLDQAMMEALVSDCVCLSVCLSVTPEDSLDQTMMESLVSGCVCLSVCHTGGFVRPGHDGGSDH